MPLPGHSKPSAPLPLRRAAALFNHPLHANPAIALGFHFACPGRRVGERRRSAINHHEFENHLLGGDFAAVAIHRATGAAKHPSTIQSAIQRTTREPATSLHPFVERPGRLIFAFHRGIDPGHSARNTWAYLGSFGRRGSFPFRDFYSGQRVNSAPHAIPWRTSRLHRTRRWPCRLRTITKGAGSVSRDRWLKC